MEAGAVTPSRCLVPGCPRPNRSSGYCAPHYQAARRQRWPIPHPGWTPTPPPRPRGQINLFGDDTDGLE